MGLGDSCLAGGLVGAVLGMRQLPVNLLLGKGAQGLLVAVLLGTELAASGKGLGLGT